jgi:dephospho-CoA kinase
MLRIGLTGGIGSGKSTVANLFKALGVPVVDADAIAHRLTQPGAPATRQILAAFGPEIAEDNGINRKRLAQRVFSDPQERARLEAILHPLVRAAMQQEVRQIQAPYCLLVIPLLIETGQRDLVDRILAVEAEVGIRLRRVQARDGRSEAEIRAIQANQASSAARRAAADDLIQNDGDLEQLSTQVAALHTRYLRLAETAKPPA